MIFNRFGLECFVFFIKDKNRRLTPTSRKERDEKPKQKFLTKNK